MNAIFKGIGASPGIAMGSALVLESHHLMVNRRTLKPDRLEAEVKRFRHAITAARKELEILSLRVEEKMGEKLSHIFDAHILILDDRSFAAGTEEHIRREHVNAEWGVRTVVKDLLAQFAAIDDPYLNERGGDLEDVYRRVLGHLTGDRSHPDLSRIREDAIIVAHTLTPSDTAALNTQSVVGFVTELGGRTSHTAIIANALEIPAVVGLHGLLEKVETGDLLVVDGERGTVLVAPDAGEKETAIRARTAWRQRAQDGLKTRDLPAVTTDGEVVILRSNIELPEEVETSLRYGAIGVGLYRSEFLFLKCSPNLPSEEDHYQVYAEMADRVAPHPCIVRTLDLGGEKYFHEVLDKEEANPVMGMRAIRLCLRRPDIFRTQLRGILRAAVGRSIQIMFPLISGVGELVRALEVLNKVRDELRQEGHAIPENIPIGIMIEVPSAAMVADLLASRVDFFSIGTNDLIQYLLAIDRGNESVAYLYEPHHPAVLRMLQRVILAARDAGISVSLCGEMASDPRYVPVLMGLGLRELSLNPVTIPAVKDAIRSTHAGEARTLTDRLLAASSADEVGRILAGEPGAADPVDSSPEA
ncbi:MAG: phosphoenolpyruvate--protein phosphotransferase [Acidobacteria bacterium]|nr:MAG: phosphoenolpyruvate--protein phosphotransferase [Acidobacteriota bacterium]